MTKSVSFNVRLENDPAKYQEIELMEKMVREFDYSGTYMQMLFTPALLEFFINQVENDFSPSVDEYLDTEDQDAEIRNLRNEVVKFEKLAKYRLNDVNGLVKEIETMKDHQVTELDDLRTEKNAHIDRLIDARSEAVHQLRLAEIKNVEIENELTTLRLELDRVKSMAFDQIVVGMK